MGRSIPVRFVVRVRCADAGVRQTDSAWRSRQAGRPTARNLAEYVRIYHESLNPGGCNEHLAQHGLNGRLAYAEIYDYHTDRVLATWRA